MRRLVSAVSMLLSEQRPGSCRESREPIRHGEFGAALGVEGGAQEFDPRALPLLHDEHRRSN
jgi:hypothetical protein